MVIVGKSLEDISKDIGENLHVSGDAIDLHIEEKGMIVRSSVKKEINLAESGSFVLTPGELFLIYTKEVISLPTNVMGLVNLRSTYARKGFIQLTALKVSPGFKGKVLLELAVATPAAIESGAKLAQLILLSTSEHNAYNGLYQYQGL